MHPEQRAALHAAQQHGVISRREALAMGMSPHQVDRRVRAGRWERLRPGIYRITGVPRTDRGDLLGAVLAVGGTASHRSAAWLAGLIDDPPDVHEITADRGASARRHRLRVHRTDDLASSDRCSVDGIAATNATRTCVDLGAVLTVPELEHAIHRALHLRLTHVDRLISRFLQLARPGRTGCRTTRAVLVRLDPALAPAESDLETLLLKVLHEHGLPEPARQHRVTVDGRTFRIDLAYPALRLAIESDGFAFHGDRSAFESDRERQNLLVLAGWTVLRFTWRQICSQPAWVAEQVRRAIARAAM
jgi:very-short-patch-repair endonuclease